MLLLGRIVQSEVKQLKVLVPLFVIFELNVGIPIELPETTLKELVSLINAGAVELILSLYKPGVIFVGSVPFITGT